MIASTFDRYGIPQWIVIATVLLPLWIKLALIIRQWRLRRWRRQFGFCESCGYDMRANPSGTCPECGFGAGTANLPPPATRPRTVAPMR